jgi:glycosyltransferase involved in cell wall biosynthesis
VAISEIEQNLARMKRILIVSFYFPPSPKVGGKRFAFISQILKRTYPELHVLTLKKKYISEKDNTISWGGKTHRTAMLPPYPVVITNFYKRVWCHLWSRYLCLLDDYSGWIFPALIKGIRTIKTNKIDLVIATGPPASAQVVGFLLSLITKTSLILDYRDPWVIPNLNSKKKLQIKIKPLVERLSIRRAIAIVFCSRIMMEEFKADLGKTINAPCHVVPNGFHSKDAIHPLSLGNAKKNMVYAGNFYGERSIGLLTNAFLQILSEGSITKESFCFHVFGNTILNEDRRLVRKSGLKDIIKFHPPVSYKRMIRYLKYADILLLLSGSDVRYAIPYKIYDYLSVKKPIFAIAPENSAVAEIMSQIDCGRLASIDNEDSILKNLRAMLMENPDYSFSGAEQYTWHNIGNRYIEVIDRIKL